MKVDFYYPPSPPDGAASAAREALDIGYDGFFSTETQHDPFLPLVVAGAAAPGIELGTAIAVAFPRSPMVTAMTSWDLARLSGGKFLLGLGTQIRPHITRRFSTEWGNPGPRLKDYILALKAIWDTWQNSTPLRYEGQFYQFSLMTPFFDPGPVPDPDIPVYIAGVGPFLLMIVQIETRFALRSLEPGETALLTVALAGEQRPSGLDVRLELPDGVIQETPALRIDETREIVWRVRAAAEGEFVARVWLGEESVAKQIVVNGQKTHVSPSVYRGSDITALVYPAERPLPSDSSVLAIHLDYPEDRGVYLGLSSATWIFFAASMVAGFALRGPLGVTF